jgi:hypothetical protein
MSVVCRKTRRDCRRRMEMMQVKPPRAKTIIRAMRWRLGSWRRERKGRGRVATRMSVRMLTPALENLRRKRLGQSMVVGVSWREVIDLPDGPLAEACAARD